MPHLSPTAIRSLSQDSNSTLLEQQQQQQQLADSSSLAVDGLDDQSLSLISYSGDKIKLIFWYKDDQPEPIYTIDARTVPTNNNNNNEANRRKQSTSSVENESLLYSSSSSSRGSTTTTTTADKQSGQIPLTLMRARHFIGSGRVSPDNSSSGNSGNLYFNITQYPMAYLTINPVNRSDAGHYRCRIDYKLARTINQNLKLNVIGEFRCLK